MIPVEIELKWALSAEAHATLGERLPALLGEARVLEQTNRFFDSADGRLRAARRSIRLRRENARLRMERDLLKRATAFWVKESGQ